MDAVSDVAMGDLALGDEGETVNPWILYSWRVCLVRASLPVFSSASTSASCSPRHIVP